MKKIDLNCDMGESFGAYTIGQDQEVLKHITSANIACGFHAGDPTVIRQTITMALEAGVAVGAHPGYPDLNGFGRRFIHMSPREIYDMVLYQVAAVAGMCKALGGQLQHVKPHGALYNVAARDASIARAIAEAVYAIEPQAILFGLAKSNLITEAEKIGLSVANEVFADRTYQQDGSLTPRTEPHAIIHNGEEAVSQVLSMIKHGKVMSIQGDEINITADTVCVHGDHHTALKFVMQLRELLQQESIQVEAIGKWKAC